MVIRIAGINHFDPSTRTKLIEWLARCSAKHGRPNFIGVEWDEDIYQTVKGQRDLFRELVKERWPEISEGLLDTLVQSLGYEGDAHLEVYPDVRILWLDAGRQEHDSVWTHYAEQRLRLYEMWVEGDVRHGNERQTLARITQGANENAGPPVADRRDEKFSARILQAVAETGDGWAIVIVGKNHADKTERSMLRLLEDAGFVCEPSLL